MTRNAFDGFSRREALKGGVGAASLTALAGTTGPAA
jgi:hypothetical protein